MKAHIEILKIILSHLLTKVFKANIAMLEVLHSIYAAEDCCQNRPNGNEEGENEDDDGGVPSFFDETSNQCHPAFCIGSAFVCREKLLSYTHCTHACSKVSLTQ